MDQLWRQGVVYVDNICRGTQMGETPWSPEITALKICICLARCIFKHRQNSKISSRLIYSIQKKVKEYILGNITS